MAGLSVLQLPATAVMDGVVYEHNVFGTSAHTGYLKDCYGLFGRKRKDGGPCMRELINPTRLTELANVIGYNVSREFCCRRIWLAIPCEKKEGWTPWQILFPFLPNPTIRIPVGKPGGG